MYNPQATRLLILVFFCMLASIAGGMMILPDDGSDLDESGRALYAGVEKSVKQSHRQSFVEQSGVFLGDFAKKF